MRTTNNIIKGNHINCDGSINKEKKYTWHIPKRLRHYDISVGDIVTVRAGKRSDKHNVIVTDVFREDVEETGRYYKQVTQLVMKSTRQDKLYLQAGKGRMFIDLDNNTKDLRIYYLNAEDAVDVGVNMKDVPDIENVLFEHIIGIPQVNTQHKAHILNQISGASSGMTNLIIFPHGITIELDLSNDRSTSTVLEAITKWILVGFTDSLEGEEE